VSRECMHTAILQPPERDQNTSHTKNFSIPRAYRQSCKSMLLTISHCTPTHLCLSLGPPSGGKQGMSIVLRLEGLVFKRMIQVASTASFLYQKGKYQTIANH